LSKDTIRLHFESLSSEELLDIWTANDRNEYAGETFNVISEILTERGVDIPPQSQFSEVKNDYDVSISGYFKFKLLISSSLIQVIYFVGMLIVTFGSVFILFERNTLGGLAALIFGNLLWRIICESSIIFFRVHDLLVLIDKKL